MSRFDPEEVDAALEEAIVAGAEALSVPLEQISARQLAWLVARLCHWNRRIRIVGPCTPMEAVERHVLDGLALLRLLDRPAVRERTHSWVDMGAGAGLPGLVLAIARPELVVTLVEPVGKKIAFAREVVHGLALSQVEIRVARIEELDPPAAPTGVLSRATFAPVEWLARGRAWVGPRGLVLVLMGPNPPGELLEGAWFVDRFRLPVSSAQRTNVIHDIS